MTEQKCIKLANLKTDFRHKHELVRQDVLTAGICKVFPLNQ